MEKIYINVKPEKCTVRTEDFTEEYVKKLLNRTNVKTGLTFDSNDIVDLMFLDQADRLLEFMTEHEVDCRIGLVYNLSHNYPLWTLIVEVDQIKGTLNPAVSKFFRWERIESQSILSLDELMLT